MTDNELIPEIIKVINDSGVFDSPVDFNSLDVNDDSAALTISKPTIATHVLGGENREVQFMLIYRVINQTIGLEGIDVIDKLEEVYSVLYRSRESLGVDTIKLTNGARLSTAYENGVLDYSINFNVTYFNDRAIMQEDK